MVDTAVVDAAVADTIPGSVLFSSLGPHDEADFLTDGEWTFGTEDFGTGVCTPRAYDFAMIDSMTGWADYEIRARVRVDTTCTASYVGLLARSTTTDPSCASIATYYCNIGIEDGRLYIGRSDAACTVSIETPAPVAGLSVGIWYTLALSVVGTTVTCSVSGPVSASLSFDDPTYASGYAGIYTKSATAHFDDVVVTAL